jgi:hypothetical protein
MAIQIASVIDRRATGCRKTRANRTTSPGVKIYADINRNIRIEACRGSGVGEEKIAATRLGKWERSVRIELRKVGNNEYITKM